MGRGCSTYLVTISISPFGHCIHAYLDLSAHPAHRSFCSTPQSLMYMSNEGPSIIYGNNIRAYGLHSMADGWR